MCFLHVPLVIVIALTWCCVVCWGQQVQLSLLDRRPLNRMLAYCQAHGIKLFTYGSLGGGLLTDKYIQEPKKGLFGECACLSPNPSALVVIQHNQEWSRGEEEEEYWTCPPHTQTGCRMPAWNATATNF